MSLVIRLADAVTAELNSAGILPGGIEAKRMVLPEFSLEQLAELKVTVVPKGVQISGATRSATQYEVSIDIGVQVKLTSGDTDIDAQVETWGDLVDQIIEYLRRRPLTQLPGAAWVSVTNDPVYAPDHLAEQRVFTSVLTLTYRLMK